MSTYKAIISDFDGTLAGADFKISTGVKEAVNAWQSSGRHFSIASGKVFPGIIEHAATYLQLTDPLIVASGAQIIDPQTKEIIHRKYIHKNDVSRIIEILKNTGILYELQTDSAVYASESALQKLQPHKHYENMANFIVQDVLLVRLVTTNTDQQRVNNFIDTHITQKFSDLFVTQSNTPYSSGVNITSKNATKQKGVIYLADMLHIRPDEIIGIGDGLNDCSFISACGYKVAMGNAVPELKAIADEVISDYEHNGVAAFINKQLHE